MYVPENWFGRLSGRVPRNVSRFVSSNFDSCTLFPTFINLPVRVNELGPRQVPVRISAKASTR